MDDGDDAAAVNGSDEDIKDELAKGEQIQDTVSGDKGERITATVSFVTDTFLDVQEILETDGAVNGDSADQKQNALIDTMDSHDNGSEEVWATMLFTDCDGKGDHLEQLTETGDSVSQDHTVTAASELACQRCLEEADGGDIETKAEGKKLIFVFEETGESLGEAERRNDDFDYSSREDANRSNNNVHHVASASIVETVASYHTFQVRDISHVLKKDSDREENDMENACYESGDDEKSDGDEVMYPDGGNFSIDFERGSETGIAKAKVVDSDSNLQDARFVVKDLVNELLDRILQEEADIPEENNEPGLVLKTRTDFPELERVELNSEDWDYSCHKKANGTQDSNSLSDSEHESLSDKQHEVGEHLSDSDQSPVHMNLTKKTNGFIDPELTDEGVFEAQIQTVESNQLPQLNDKATAVDSVSDEQIQNGSGSSSLTSPRAEYPLNYNNYKVCRMLSPGVKECLILETGEQVLYDCSKHSSGSHIQQASLSSARDIPNMPFEEEKVKRKLFSGAEKTKATDSAPISEVPSNRKVTAVPLKESQSSVNSSPPHPHQTHEPLSSRKAPEQSAEAEQSHDGSYLWLQQQVKWRAGNAAMPIRQPAKEARTVYREKSPRNQSHVEKKKAETNCSEWGTGHSGLGLSTSVSESVDTSGSLSRLSSIPSFKTLKDQQVSWLSMYRMLEDQYRGELQAQYAEHQRILGNMQRHLEGDLLSQQNNMRQKLNSHREVLREPSPSAGYRHLHGRTESDSRSTQLNDSDSERPKRHSFLFEHPQAGSQQSADRLISGSKNFTGPDGSSQKSPRDHWKSKSEISFEKQLRGGVYSSPMPIGKSEFDTDSANKTKWSQDSSPSLYNCSTAVTSPSGQEDQLLPPRIRLSLQEKHAKHLSDLRAYYEAEIQDLRHRLSALSGEPVLLSAVTVSGRETARERILQEENQNLRQQLRDLKDALDDAHIHSRELEQKLQGLEIRAADYAERYEESQENVLKLKNRLEELHSYAKDRESVLEQVQANEQRQAATLQALYKAQEELAEASRRDKSSLHRLMDKHEALEKEYYILKEASTSFEKKLHDARLDAVELNRMVTKLEQENKRLSQENDRIHQRLTIYSSLPTNNYSEVETVQMKASHRDSSEYDGRVKRSQPHSESFTEARRSIQQSVKPPRRVMSDEENSDLKDSPLLRAERELNRLQQAFVPRLQPKKYSSTDSLGPLSGDLTIIDVPASPSRSSSSSFNSLSRGPKERRTKEKKTVTSSVVTPEKAGNRQTVSSKAGFNTNVLHTTRSSPSTRFDVGVQQTGSGSSVAESHEKKERVGDRMRKPGSPVKSVQNENSTASGWVDATLERIRSGDIVARPKWEDVYTSLAKPYQTDKTFSLNMTQEEMLRDRIRSIDEMERRYDALQIEKKTLESQLSKVPSQGRDRKSRKDQETIEDKLDSVDHELGSLRMMLKRYQVLKSTI